MKSILNSLACTIVFTSFIFLISSSCQEKGNLYYVSLGDSVQYAIKNYITENHINVKSRVITTDWMSNPYRTDIYISNTSKQSINDQANIPSYYSVVSDSILVLVYSGVEAGIARNTQIIQQEMKAHLVERGIELQPDNKNVTHTKTWLYSLCGDRGKLIRETSIKDLYYIPCRNDSIKW